MFSYKICGTNNKKGFFMQVLVLDNDESTQQIIDCYSEIEKNWHFIHFDESQHEIESESIDMILVDFSNKKYNDLLENYLQKYPQTKTVIISDRLENSEAKGCDYCIENRNKRRLIKPLEPKKLYDLIKNFDEVRCEYYKVFVNLASIFSTIIKRFPSLSYDEENNRVFIEEKSLSNRHTYEFVSLLNILEQNKIEYLLLDEYQIQIK